MELNGSHAFFRFLAFLIFRRKCASKLVLQGKRVGAYGHDVREGVRSGQVVGRRLAIELRSCTPLGRF